MKRIIQISIGIILLFIGYKLNLPWDEFPFEHFEYEVARILPFSWKLVSIFSRMLLGLIFVSGFYLLLKNDKIGWLKHISLIAICIPFIINPVFPENWRNESPLISENLAFKTQDLKNNEKVLVAYFTDGCRFCKEAALKLDIAKKKERNFPEVIVVSNNSNLESFFLENNFSYQIIEVSTEILVETAKGSFPHFQLVKSNKLIFDWNNRQFNYEVLDLLSKD